MRNRTELATVLVTLAIPAVLLAACSQPSAAPTTAQSPGSAQQMTQGGGQQGGGLQGRPSRHQSGIYSGRYSAAFARCMRAHGVPDFPDSQGGRLSGVDTRSSRFQSALYHACKSLAPADWVSAPPLGPLQTQGPS